jgi:hypothetical protein
VGLLGGGPATSVSPRSNEKRTHGRTQTQDEAILQLVVAPAGAGKFAARLGARFSGTAGRQPAGRPLVVRMENANVSDEPLGLMGLK